MKNILKVTLLVMAVFILLVGCSKDKKEVLEKDVDIKKEISFSKGIKNNMIKDTENLEDEYVVYVYSGDCDYCGEIEPAINKYVESVDNALPVYAYDINDTDNSGILDYFISKGLIYNGNPTFGYFYDDVLYENVIGEFKAEEVPSAGTYKNLEAIEIEISEDENNEHSHGEK